MWDQLGAAGFFAAFIGNPFGIRGAAAAGMTAAWVGFHNGAIRFDEFLGRIIGPRLTKLMIAVMALIGLLAFASEKADEYLTPEMRAMSVHSTATNAMVVGLCAILLLALYQRFASQYRPRSVSFASCCFILILVPITLMVIEIVDAGRTQSGWHLTIAAGYGLLAALTLGFLGAVASWVVRKAIELLETGLTLVGEPILAAALPGTTLQNVNERTKKLFDLFREDYWSQRLSGIAIYFGVVMIPYFAILSWWIEPKFFVWFSGSYLIVIALAWAATQEGLFDEVLLSRQSFLRWLMILFVPVRLVLLLIGTPDMWKTQPLVKNHGYLLPIVVGLVALLVLSAIVKGMKDSKFRSILLVITGLTLGWAAIALYVRAEGRGGWSLDGLTDGESTPKTAAVAAVISPGKSALDAPRQNGATLVDPTPKPPPTVEVTVVQVPKSQPKPSVRTVGKPMNVDDAKARLNARSRDRQLPVAEYQ
ncbi:MAG: hypothetical protein ABIO72_03265 [Patescibacteria group bacterium]